jgi:hypothetical protein
MAFISEVHFRGTGVANSGEFVEITLGPNDDPADFVVSVYDDDGTLHTNAGIAGGEVNLGTLTGSVHPDNPTFTIYVISVGIRNATSDANEGSGIALTNTDTDTVVSFYSADNIAAFNATEGAASGATSENILEHTNVEIGQSYQWDIDGNLTFETIEGGDSVLCLAGCSHVWTEGGELSAQDLNVGDRVWTVDHGFQPIKWIGKTELSAEYLSQHPNQQPISLAKNCLGPGFPRSDLTVSRQHRVLVASPVAERMTGEFEVLVPAVKLLSVPGVEFSPPDKGVTYVHLLFERHEVILAEGALVESLMLTDYVNSVTNGKEQDDQKCVTPARLIVDGKKARQLMARIVKNNRSIYESKRRFDLRTVAA